MKFFSEKLNKLFDTEEALITSEKEFEDTQAKIKAEKELASAKKSEEKKALAKAIEDAEHSANIAKERLELARTEAQKIIDSAKEEANNIIKPAKEDLERAQSDWYEAVCEFYKKFGTYNKIYTGEKAYNEIKRNIDFIDKLFTYIW